MTTKLRSDQVLVTIGTPCTMSAVGSSLTTGALVDQDDAFVLFAASDAGLVTLDVGDEDRIRARWIDGSPASVEEVERRHGTQLRSNLGIRVVDQLAEAVTDIAAPLPHDLTVGGLRRLMGLTYDAIRHGDLRDMHGLFSDDPQLGPSLQAQLFAYAGLGALASLPGSLRDLIEPHEFRLVAGAAFNGLDSHSTLRPPGSPPTDTTEPTDRFAARLASSLMSHGPALVATMLAPSYPIGRTTKNPSVLDGLRGATGFMRVPQAPLNSIAACASSLTALCEIAPQLVCDIPGLQRPRIVLWTAADAATRGGFEVVESFGPNALVTGAKLEALNEGRKRPNHRDVADSLAPFDVDACGTVIGDGGSGLIITTLEFALRHFLDITSIIVGWGQSGETGGKAHFAGVGFGGENALIHAHEMASAGHGLGVDDFGYLVAHATGTVTNSKTDLGSVARARRIARERNGRTGPPTSIRVGAPKALGDGHTMGETGLKAVAHALRYLLGEQAVGIPTLRQLDPDLAPIAGQFDMGADPIAGRPDGGVLCATQGFGGYNGAVALLGATPDTIGRYGADPRELAAYLERWPQTRVERRRRELGARATQGSTLELALHHRWVPLAT